MRAERAQESRRKILESAREIFFRDGFEAANLDEVAQSAGIAKGTIYRHFESKAELYVAVLSNNADVFVERMRQTVVLALFVSTIVLLSHESFALGFFRFDLGPRLNAVSPDVSLDLRYNIRMLLGDFLEFLRASGQIAPKS